MKISLVLLLALAGTQGQGVAAKPFAGSLGGINTFLDFRDEVDAANACDATAYSNGSVTRGLALVYPPFLKKIEKEFGHGTIHPTALEEAVHHVQTKRFTETTQLHRDSYTNEQGLRQGVGESDNGMVGFIFRNTNEDAHFETDDDGGFCFPVREGTFMSFDGSKPHQTIVNSGHVELIGPFLLSSKALFGVGDCDCPSNCCSANPPCFFNQERCVTVCSLPACGGTKSSKAPTAKSSKEPDEDLQITSNELASIQQTNKSILSFLIAGTCIVAAAALLKLAWNSRQARSINDLDLDEEAVDGFEEDDFEDESNEHQLRDVVVGEGAVEIVETH